MREGEFPFQMLPKSCTKEPTPTSFPEHPVRRGPGPSLLLVWHVQDTLVLKAGDRLGKGGD